MGFRFRRSVRLFPGVRLNVSGKSGLSASFGTRGAWLTVGKRGTRATMGIHGTGISYTRTSHIDHHHEQPRVLAPEEAATEYRRSVIRGRIYWVIILVLVVWYVWSVAAGR